MILDDIIPECDRPPIGWRCSRMRGHQGPCAAIPVDVRAPLLKRIACVLRGGHNYKHISAFGEPYMRLWCFRCDDRRAIDVRGLTE